MSTTVQSVMHHIARLAPVSLPEKWDNVGLMIGSADQAVRRLLVALTVTETVVKRALEEDVDLIVSHHPLIFDPLHQIRTDAPVGALAALLLKNDIALYVAHTNLDNAPEGLNQWLADVFGLSEIAVLAPHDQDATCGLGRIGKHPPISLADLSQTVHGLLGSTVRIVGDPAHVCTTIATCGGAGGGLILDAKRQGADVLITGDLRYHDAVNARAHGLALIDAGHAETECVMVLHMVNYLTNLLPDNIAVLDEYEETPFQTIVT